MIQTLGSEVRIERRDLNESLKSEFGLNAERFEEALGALDNIPRPRNDDLVYRVAASARSGEALALQRNVAALREAIPTFEPSAFAASLPYEREEDRRRVLDALEAAGF